MHHIAALAGVVAASFMDPVFWVMLLAGAAVVFAPARFALLALVAIGSAAVRVMISSSNRAALGLPESPFQVHIFVATALCVCLAFAMAYLVARRGWGLR